MIERYAKQMNVEARLMVDMFRTQIFPAALKYQRKMGETIAVHQEIDKAASSLVPLYKKLAEVIYEASGAVQSLEPPATKRSPSMERSAEPFSAMSSGQHGRS